MYTKPVTQPLPSEFESGEGESTVQSTPIPTPDEPEDFLSEMYDSYQFSPEQAAAKRMSWANSSASLSLLFGEPPTRNFSPTSNHSSGLHDDVKFPTVMDSFERACEQELMFDQSDGGGSSSRARVRATAFSPRAGSCPTSPSSHRSVRNSGSISETKRELHNPTLSSSPKDPTRGRSFELSRSRRESNILSTTSSPSRGGQTDDAVGKRVPFGFRSSFRVSKCVYIS